MAAFAKCILMLINGLFMVISLAFIAAGAILVFFPGKVLGDVYDEVKGSVNNPTYSLPDSADDLGDVPFVKTVGVALLAFGAALFILCFLAYTGACCPSCCKCLLIVYCIVLVILVIVEIVLGTMFFVSDSPLHDEARSFLKDKIKDDYEDDGDDAFSQSLNLIQQHLHCCGIDSVADFGAKQHRACENAYLQTGCYSKLQDEVEDNIVWCGVGLAVLCLLQLIEVYCAIALYKDNKVRPF